MLIVVLTLWLIGISLVLRFFGVAAEARCDRCGGEVELWPESRRCPDCGEVAAAARGKRASDDWLGSGLDPVHALVADQEGRLLGLVHYIFHRSTISLTTNCYLQDLFTLESSRGQGVGRALIEEVYSRAQIAGSSRVYWHTHKTNATAMQLYDKVAENSGFVVYRRMLE